MRENNNVKKTQEGNTVVMVESVRDEILDGYEKRKVQFLKQLLEKNI